MTAHNLVQRVIAGDNAARETFYDKYYKLVWNVIIHIVDTAEDREDLFQAAFLHLFKDECRCLAQWRGENLTAFLARTVRNLAIDVLRAKRAERNRMTEWPQVRGEEGDAEARDEDLPDTAPLPDVLLLTQELCTTLRDAVQQLSERDRELIRRFFLEEQSYDEIAAEMAITTNNVGVSLKRARTRLKAVLQRQYPGALTEELP